MLGRQPRGGEEQGLAGPPLGALVLGYMNDGREADMRFRSEVVRAVNSGRV